jgi:hypothetical protein
MGVADGYLLDVNAKAFCGVICSRTAEGPVAGVAWAVAYANDVSCTGFPLVDRKDRLLGGSMMDLHRTIPVFVWNWLISKVIHLFRSISDRSCIFGPIVIGPKLDIARLDRLAYRQCGRCGLIAIGANSCNFKQNRRFTVSGLQTACGVIKGQLQLLTHRLDALDLGTLM